MQNKEKDIPNRMCISCREKKEKEELFRLAEIKNKYAVDLNNKIQSRGIYICKNPICIEKASKNKKYNIDIDVLMQMLGLLKKENKNMENKLTAISKSKEVTFGIKMVSEKVWKQQAELVIIALDISKKNKEKILRECEEKNVKYIFYGNKKELGQVFGKAEINVFGILDKKTASGLIKSLGGEPVEGT